MQAWVHLQSTVVPVQEGKKWQKWLCIAHTWACTHHKVSARKLVCLLWADRVDKPSMRGINKAAQPPTALPILST